ncbi:uncharacterized protein [Acropora muricata]|uniref:uncharacterized protein n=1 Tax=Acropora muricata TaxID=159855 RepID=UPI0034E3C9A7
MGQGDGYTDGKLSKERDRNEQERSAEEPGQSVRSPGPGHTTHLARKVDLPGNLQSQDSRDGKEKSDDLSFAKQQLGSQQNESKVLGLPWDKEMDTLTVNFPKSETATSKREVLKNLAKVYDPLGLATPLTLQGKLIYREICNLKVPWDAQLSKQLVKKVGSWEQSLPTGVTMPRPVAHYRDPVADLQLHAFGDASTHGVGAAVYAVIRQPSGTTQRLVGAKGRLAKLVPRLELVSAHMATNLVINVQNTLTHLPSPKVYAWLDSTVALHWILGNGLYKQFVDNRVKKIHEHPEIQWRHVPTDENPADLASRGGRIKELWWNGPEWLSNEIYWPPNLMTSASTALEEEAKVIRELLNTVQTEEPIDMLDELLEKRDLRRALRVAAWVTRFVHNCRRRKKLTGTLMKNEIDEVKQRWILLVQHRDRLKPHYEQTQKQLNFQVNPLGLIECRGRIQGKYPIYLPRSAVFTRKLVQKIHCETLHGGVGLTMTAVRERYWIPKLRSLVKSVRSECHGCKRFTTTPFSPPIPGPLPEDRTTVATAFEVIGTDFAGPIRYKQRNKREGKAYLAVFTCSLSRAVHLELLPSLLTDKYIQCLKRLIARRGRPRVIYSDNGGTFVKTSKWVRELRKDERLQGLLDEYEIKWKFNLSRAPWWGGQFDRSDKDGHVQSDRGRSANLGRT